MKKYIKLLAVLVFVFAGCGGGQDPDPVDNGNGPVVVVSEPKVTVTFLSNSSNSSPGSTDLKISRRVMTGLPSELESRVKYLHVFYQFANRNRWGTVRYEFSSDATAASNVSVPFNTNVVSVSLLSVNETEVAQGILIMDFENKWVNADASANSASDKIPNMPIGINLNEWISSDLAFFNLPGTWSTTLTSSGQTKWYKVKFVADDHLGRYYQNVMDFCKFITLGGKMALSLENVWLPYFEPRCLELNCPSVVVKPTIEITLTDDTGKEWKFNFEISSFIPFLEDTPVALYY